ncbi:MAG: TonB family protein [Nitrospira sp.]|nr:TonB family protein [Nitrospira sp.]
MTAPKAEPIVAEGVSRQAAMAANESDFQPAVDDQQVEPVSQYADHPEESLRSDAAVGEVAAQTNTRHASSMSGHSIAAADNAAQAAPSAVASPATSPLPPPEIERLHDSSSLQVSAQPENPEVLQRPQAISRPVVTRAAFPDYTWLMDTLRTKLEQVKVYPSSAKASHSQGRVVVRVSILSDGHILDSEVEESSGHPILDQAALDALQAASPLTLAHRLEGESVVMLVPLNYQLEQ